MTKPSVAAGVPVTELRWIPVSPKFQVISLYFGGGGAGWCSLAWVSMQTC